MKLEHLSYSALSRYEECPRSYYLGRVVDAPQRQTWFFPIGTAVHSMIEDWLLGYNGNPPRSLALPVAESYFYPLIKAQMEKDKDDVNWLSGGSQDAPVIRKRALDLVKRCFEKAINLLEDIDVWEVEYDATGNLPGCEVPIKAFVDVIGEHKKHGPVIVDWKTGKQKPKNNLQLETYSALLSQPSVSGEDHPFTEHGSLAFTGLWAMLNPDASQARKVDLSGVDPSALGARYQKAYEAITKKIWKANAGFGCRFCVQSANCLVESPGSQADKYDKSEQDGYPY